MGSSLDNIASDSTGRLLAWIDRAKVKTLSFTVGTAICWRSWRLQAAYIAAHQIVSRSSDEPRRRKLTQSRSGKLHIKPRPDDHARQRGYHARLGWSTQIIKDALGITPLYFRPPYGDIHNPVHAIVKAVNLMPVM